MMALMIFSKIPFRKVAADEKFRLKSTRDYFCHFPAYAEKVFPPYYSLTVASWHGCSYLSLICPKIRVAFPLFTVSCVAEFSTFQHANHHF
jgi:hypothetical protein